MVKILLLILTLILTSRVFPQNEDLITTDEFGQKVNLKMRPKVGDTFRYKMVANTISDEKSPATNDESLHTQQIITYYYTQKVMDINESGVITFNMKFDSITVFSAVASGDSSVSETYNSNIKDSVHFLDDFSQYNSLIEEYFKLRVSELGKIYDAYGLENIHKKIFKALGDTLTQDEKESIIESLGTESIKSIIHNQYQKFPDYKVYKDSSWFFTNKTNLLVFPVKNVLNYVLLDIYQDDSKYLLEIEPSSEIEFIQTEHIGEDEGLKIKLLYSDCGGKGKVFFILSRGCIIKKETKLNINLGMLLSIEDENAKSLQKLSTSLSVELLN